MIRPILRPFFAAALSVLPVQAYAAQDAPVLVELFTSQGCYSCPPADDLLAELAGRPDILALSFHVTYWDRLGWPDSFGQDQFTERQYRYASLLESSSVYTPQAIIAGEIDVVGSRRQRLERAVDFVKREGGAVRIEIDSQGWADLPGNDLGEPAGIWIAAYEDEERVFIESGENGGKTLDYHRIVKVFEHIHQWNGQSGRLPLDLEAWRGQGLDGVVVAIQSPASGRVLALGELRL